MKNKFLLLGATALLSTLSTVAMAERDGASAAINTSVDIYSPIIATEGYIEFGDVVAGNGKTVVIQPNARYDETASTATLIGSGGYIDPAKFKGGNVNANGSNCDDFDSESYFSADDTHLYSGTGDTAIDCGETPIDSFSMTCAADTSYGGIKMSPGATFIMDNGIEAATQTAGGHLRCTGAVTYTLVLSY